LNAFESVVEGEGKVEVEGRRREANLQLLNVVTLYIDPLLILTPSCLLPAVSEMSCQKKESVALRLRISPSSSTQQSQFVSLSALKTPAKKIALISQQRKRN